ncbi:MAG TPA: hypothetical protein VGG30_09615, partial [Pirellulales bacterium]
MTRREAIVAGAALAGAAAAGAVVVGLERTVAAEEEKARGKWIDAHSHIWSTDVEHYPLAGKLTVKDLDPPSFTDDELMAVARPEGVGRVVLIQHSIFHRFDNSYLLDAVKRHWQRFRIV